MVTVPVASWTERTDNDLASMTEVLLATDDGDFVVTDSGEFIFISSIPVDELPEGDPPDATWTEKDPVDATWTEPS